MWDVGCALAEPTCGPKNEAHAITASKAPVALAHKKPFGCSDLSIVWFVCVKQRDFRHVFLEKTWILDIFLMISLFFHQAQSLGFGAAAALSL